jgi:hypothetical protein
VRRTRAAVAAGEEGEGENNGDASHKAIITNSADDGV